MTRRLPAILLALAITGALAWLLFTPTTVDAMRNALRQADWWTLVLAIVLGAAVQWLRAWRFAIMTTGTLALPPAGFVRIAFQLNFFNFVLPFRLGEISYPVLMRRSYGQGLFEATGILLLARLFDLATVAAILFAAASWLGIGGAPSGDALLALAALLMAALPIALVSLGNMAFPAGRREGTRLGALAIGLARLGRWPARVMAVALSLVVWLAFGVIATIAADAVHVPIRPAVAMLGAAAGNLAFALPINGIAGLGASQAAWVAATTVAGLPFSQAVVSALALHAAVLANALIFGGLAAISGAKSPALETRLPALRDSE